MGNELYIRFRATVNSTTIRQLLECLDDRFRNACSLVHIMISTPGGSVKDGIDIYNYISALPMPVHTYNIGQVDSIGIMIFCAGERRFSVPHARFLLHPISMNVLINHRFDEHLLNEHLNSLRVDQSNIAKVVAHTSGKTEKAILEKIHKRVTLSPEEAKAENLLHEIKSRIIPEGAQIISIEDAFNVANSMQSPAQISITPTSRSMPRPISYSMPPISYSIPRPTSHAMPPSEGHTIALAV